MVDVSAGRHAVTCLSLLGSRVRAYAFWSGSGILAPRPLGEGVECVNPGYRPSRTIPGQCRPRQSQSRLRTTTADQADRQMQRASWRRRWLGPAQHGDKIAIVY